MQDVPKLSFGPNILKGTCGGALQFKAKKYGLINATSAKKENFMAFQSR